MLPSKSAPILFVLLLLLTTGPVLAKMYRPPVSFGSAAKALDEIERRAMPPLDNAALLTAARANDGPGTPYYFAHALAVDFGAADAGTWETLADGSRLWRLLISSPGAVNLNLGFSHFDLPPGAALWIYNAEGTYVEGPYTVRHRSRRGRLYTPIIPGDEIVVELHVPADADGPLDVRLEGVHHGFRSFPADGGVLKNHGACNIDVVCPEGDPWRDQIRAVAYYSGQGVTGCTGQLVNNTAEDDKPYFLTAYHCGLRDFNDDTMVFYWNYQSPVCGQQDGGSLEDNQTGSIFRAAEAESDFALAELSQMPDADFNLYYLGWDVSGNVPQGSVGIHHPQGDVKSITFNDDALGNIGWNPIARTFVPGGESHWEISEWEQGTTEPASSGSCLYDPTSKLCVGVLTGGFASCSRPNEFDGYGKLSYAWETAGTTPESRLRDWLDPTGSGATTLVGKDPGQPDGSCQPSDTVLCLRNRRFQIEVSRAGTDGPGPATIVQTGSQESGLFWFFSPDNWEMLLKVLDGCSINDRFWVFAASATDVEWTITVTDTQSGASKRYSHAAGQPSEAITDTDALAVCP